MCIRDRAKPIGIVPQVFCSKLNGQLSKGDVTGFGKGRRKVKLAVDIVKMCIRDRL